jgi:hypothetical protein
MMTKRSLHTLRLTMAGLACLTWVLPLRAFATDGITASPPVSRSTPQIHDVALGSGGRLVGQFVDGQGQPRANQTVMVVRPSGQQWQTQTDASGRFVLEGMSGGLYQIATTDAVIACRCWSDNAAPPASIREVLIVSGDGIQRGQRPLADFLFSGPFLIALVIAAAIAIPIAVHNSQDAS